MLGLGEESNRNAIEKDVWKACCRAYIDAASSDVSVCNTGDYHNAQKITSR